MHTFASVALAVAATIALAAVSLPTLSAEPEEGFALAALLEPQPVPLRKLRFSFFTNGDLLAQDYDSGSDGTTFVYSAQGILLRTFVMTDCRGAAALGAGEILCVVETAEGSRLQRRSAVNGSFVADMPSIAPRGIWTLRSSSQDASVVGVGHGLPSTTVRVVVVQAGGGVLASWEAPFGDLPGEIGNSSSGAFMSVVRDGDYLYDVRGGVWTLQGQFLRRIAAGCMPVVWNGRAFDGQGLRSVLVEGLEPAPLLGQSSGWNACDFGFAISAAGTIATGGTNGARRELYEAAFRTQGRLLADLDAPRPSVVSVRPRVGASLVDLTYRVVDGDSVTATTAALAFVGVDEVLANAYPVRTLVEGSAGRLGTAQPTGVLRSLVWDPVADGIPGPAPRISIRLMAADSALPMDLGFVTLPANVPRSGDPPLTITSVPVSQDDYRKLAYWLLARGDSAVALGNDAAEGRVLRGTTGVYAGQVLFAGTSNTITSIGRQFFNERLGMREATPEEVARAREGSTGGVFESTTPRLQFAERPLLANEIGVEMTQNADEYFLVPL